MEAAVQLGELVVTRAAAPAAPRPFLIGIAGPVAVGKSVLAGVLADALAAAGRRVDVVSTDGFLLPNAVLAERGLAARKGFPESYDVDRLRVFVAELRAGEAEVRVPVYSHEHYDVRPDETLVVRDADVVIVEGVNALQEPVLGGLDLAVYLDADERDVIGWYGDRFARLRAADLDAHPFYRQFAALAENDVRAVAELVWTEVNGRNLRDHIAPSALNADVVVRKGRNHRLESISRPS